MEKNLVIVESPAKAKTISKYLDNTYIVRASMGHVSDLPKNDLGIDVENNFQPTYEISKEKVKLVNELKREAKDATKIWIATDEDREGEAIAWHIMNSLKIKKDEYERIAFHEITKDAILKAIKNPRKINLDLVDAQQARRVIDRLVGYKLSPMLWRKVQKGLSAGRVQSVAVRILVEREEEIRAFKSAEYWKIKGAVQNTQQRKFSVLLEKIGKKKVEFQSEEDVKKALDKALGSVDYVPIKSEKSQKDYLNLNCVFSGKKELIVSSLTKKTVKKSPAPPFTTSTLQQEAHRKFGFPVASTMSLAQQLYEGIDLDGGRVGLITYMRTDSVNLAEESLVQMKEFIGKQFGEKYTVSSARKYKNQSKGAQEAHEAIRPVNISVIPDQLKDQLNPSQLKLYTLIWKRTIATQMQEAILENTEVKLELVNNRDYIFAASGQIIKFDGFMKLYIEDSDDEEEEEESLLPSMNEGDVLDLLSLNALQNFTKPPARYTEASLVKKLESEGIGRPSTYAPTISTIVNRGYVEKEKKHLIPTDLAFVVNKFLCEYFSDIVDYKFTAKMEESFDEVAEGKQKWVEIVQKFYGPFAERLDDTSKTAKKYAEETEQICPECKNKLVIRMSRYGKFLSCSGFPNCKYTAKIEGQAATGEQTPKEPDVETGEICPTCNKPLVTKSGRFGKFIACSDYPQCKYTKKTINVVKEAGCPKCKGNIVEKKTRKGKLFFGCANYPKCDFAVWKKEDLDDEENKPAV